MSKPSLIIEKLNTSQSLLGLDFGDKTIGIAVSDRSHTIASPVKTIQRKGVNKDIKVLLEVINEYNAGALIFGLPLSLSGDENKSTLKVRSFAKELKLKMVIIIEFYDERFSSDVIFKELKPSHSSKKIKKKLDQQSAAYILQGFLDNANYNP